MSNYLKRNQNILCGGSFSFICHNMKFHNCYHNNLPPLINIYFLGVIRECGGKMHLRENEYEKAHTDFFEAFKNYDESGSPRRTTCLKYLVLANMLMKSGINPFDSQEAKPYKNDPEILGKSNCGCEIF